MRYVAKLGLLPDGEILCEVELAVFGSEPGALIVTDLRVLFVRTTVIRRKTHVTSIPLGEVVNVLATSGTWLGRELGILRLWKRVPDELPEEVEFERISGGRPRAAEMTDTIERQRELLARRDGGPAAT